MGLMPDNTLSAERPSPRPVRDVADAYVVALADLNPMLATRLGLNPGDDRLPDASPAGQQAWMTWPAPRWPAWTRRGAWPVRPMQQQQAM